jgi:acyl carrier protein
MSRLIRSGKVDRKNFPAPQYEKRHTPLISPTQPHFDHVKLVSSIWKKILHKDEVDVQRNFFDNGGDSLLATELAFDLGEKLNITVPLVKIFQYPTVLSLSKYLKEESSRYRAKRDH